MSYTDAHHDAHQDRLSFALNHAKRDEQGRLIFARDFTAGILKGGAGRLRMPI